MGAAGSSPTDPQLSPGGLLAARTRLLESADSGISPDNVESLLKKLGPSAARSPGDLLHYTCRGLADYDLVALGALTVRLPTGLRGLVSINLSHNNIGDNGAAALGEALASGAPRLRRLQLHENRIGDAGMAGLSIAMAPDGASVLQQLRIEFNRVGDAGLRALAKAWAAGGGQELLELFLVGNQISAEGVAALAEQLYLAPKLRTLALGSSSGGNRVGDVGARALVDALREQPRRTGVLTINLKTCALTPEGEAEIDAAVKADASLALISSRALSARPFSAEGLGLGAPASAPSALETVSEVEETPAGERPAPVRDPSLEA